MKDISSSKRRDRQSEEWGLDKKPFLWVAEKTSHARLLFSIFILFGLNLPIMAHPVLKQNKILF